jgi:CDP-paratose 2-epimerase
MTLRELGITTRIDCDDPWLHAILERGEVERVRLQPPRAEEHERAYPATIAALQERAELLLSLRPRAREPGALLDELHELLPLLDRRAVIELDAALADESPWGCNVDAIAGELAEASALVRSTDRAIAWGVGAPIRAARVVTELRRRALIAAEDAVLLDAEGLAIDEPLLAAISRLTQTDRVARVWLAAGDTAVDRELAEHARALTLPIDRMYWSHREGSSLARIWLRHGPRRTARGLAQPVASPRAPRILITGGAGFIGSNLAARLLQLGRSVVVLDDLRRDGVEHNVAWLAERGGERFAFMPGDTRCRESVREALAGVEQVFHLAAQVAVTTSVDDPLEDFSINAGGTLGLLEEIRRLAHPPGIVFTSTNKVYGDLDDLTLIEHAERWAPSDTRLLEQGVGEWRSLALHSPYGCSKGTADQYVLDYAKSFGIHAVVFRMSCIYGPRQLGNEDQGWVAHFVRRVLEAQPITIYGDGKQVRDLLFVDDLVAALLTAAQRIGSLSGTAFNIGGGPANAASLLELLARIEQLGERPTRLSYAPWRRGDQRWYVSDTSRFTSATGWRATVDIATGLARLHAWLREHASEVARGRA